jgi:protoporphyrinogen oxidase
LIHACVDYAGAKLSPNNNDGSFENAVIQQYGRTIADSFLLGYTEKLWGVPASQLSRSVSGRRLRGLNLRTFLVEAFGGSRAKTEHLDGRFYYPRFGIGEIMERFADRCGREHIHLNSRITRVICSDHRVEQIEVNQSECLPVSTVISSLPLSEMFRALDPAPPREILDEVSKIRFRNVVLVALFLNRPRVTKNASLYFPDPRLPITRVYEPKNRSEAMAPLDQTSLVAEIPANMDSADWKADDRDLVERCTRYLSDCGLIQASEVFDSAVFRIPFAYPILELGYESAVHRLLNYLRRYQNLHVIGRNGEFAYTHIHNLMRAGRETVERVMRDSGRLVHAD